MSEIADAEQNRPTLPTVAAVAAEHGINLDTPELDGAIGEDTPEPVRPWARLFLALQLELEPRGIATGGLLADARNSALVAALVELGVAQATWLENDPQNPHRPLWPMLNPVAVELEAIRGAVDTLLGIRAELRRLDHEIAEHRAAEQRRAALLAPLHPDGRT